MLYDEINLSNFPTNSSVPTHDTRNSDQLRVNQCNFYTKINSPYYLEYNNVLPQSFTSLNKRVFKNRLKSLLLNLFIYKV